jgi:hypothetical protein
MAKLPIALSVGVVIGLVDVGSMLLRKAPALQIAMAFTHWVVVAVLVAYSTMPLPAWARGLVIGVITTLPMLFTLAQTHPNAVPVVAALAVVLGAVTGVAVNWALARGAV